MNIALDASRQRVVADDAQKGHFYYCPICGGPVIPKQGQWRVWHFSHISSCLDSWNYDMSEWHRSWQERFPMECREVVVERGGKIHRADVLIGKYVIEFQHSPISADEVQERNRFYIACGYRVIWVFDEIEKYEDGFIQEDVNNSSKFYWSYARKSLSCILPQRNKSVAVILQLSAPESDDDCGWLVKVEWAIQQDDGADYKCFCIDEKFTPDFSTPEDFKDIFLNKEERFRNYLSKNLPYEKKCARYCKGHIRDWNICKMSGEWHHDSCKECIHNLITEYRKGNDYQKGGRFYYCIYPRRRESISDEANDIPAPSIRTP